ncbi:sigma-70 family RNA polymerase sigma factor [Flavobacterium sp. TP390]|uniref:Sigma-70 family RNA polymerase sigma factor n=1 Tax=Flavobacterium profundi TaxID=1774945 RepID=A0A6I4IGN6_9FLAO|nr:sigma-70 family RNA polymerase sigma factor [Flavobacterium profundi]MVO08863.1 sigma-70 family RNA polymerase sigma factor [Flavobacterium profundi]
MNTNFSIEDLRTGNNRIYSLLYKENKEAFYSYARKFTISEEEIEEVYQDALVVFYENIAEGRLTSFESSIKTYLFSIGKYKIYELLRRKKKIVSTITLEQVENIENLTHWNLEENVLDEQQEKVKTAFKNLGKRCQRILELFYTENKSIKEIMHLENYENENTVKAQKSRCMKSLREMITNKS